MGDTRRVYDAATAAGAAPPPRAAAPARLDLDIELVPGRGAQDSDAAWGDPVGPAPGDPADVRRLLEDKPPHHVG